LQVSLQDFKQGRESMEQKLKLVQVDVLGRDSVPSEVGAHEDAETILADN